MKMIRSLEALSQFRDEVIEQKNRMASVGKIQVVVGLGSCGIAVGALEVLHAIQQQIAADHPKDVIVSQTGCIGLCGHEPLLEVTRGSAPKVTYGRVTPAMAKRIYWEHILGGKIIDEFVVDTTPFPTI